MKFAGLSRLADDFFPVVIGAALLASGGGAPGACGAPASFHAYQKIAPVSESEKLIAPTYFPRPNHEH